MSEYQDRLKRVRLLIMDVDGTLTDGAMYYSPRGEELKRFSTRDGMGITLLRRAGIDTAIVTSEQSEIVVKRAEKLRIPHVILGSHDKSSDVRALASRLGIAMDDIAYIGDDVNDLHVMGLVGLAACPSDAVAAIRNTAHVVCTFPGGNGAVRELCEAILMAQDAPVTLPEHW